MRSCPQGEQPGATNVDRNGIYKSTHERKHLGLSTKSIHLNQEEKGKKSSSNLFRKSTRGEKAEAEANSRDLGTLSVTDTVPGPGDGVGYYVFLFFFLSVLFLGSKHVYLMIATE